MALSTSQAKLLVGSNCTLDVLKLGRSTWNLFHMSYLPGFSSHIPAGEYENHQKCWLVGDMLLPRKLILLHKHGYVFDLPTLNKTHSPPLFATHVSLIPWRLDVISFCFAGLSKSGFAKGGLSLWTRKIGCDSYIPISINNYKHHCNIKYHICIWYFHITTKNYTSLWSLSAQNQGLDSFWCHVHCQAQQRPRISQTRDLQAGSTTLLNRHPY